MFRQSLIAVFAAVALLGSFTRATADGPKAAGGGKQIVNSIGMKLTLVPSGEFMMGSKESAQETAAFFKKKFSVSDLEADRFTREHPQHRVRITRPFYLGKYHVTRGQFRQFIKDSGYKTDAEKSEEPGVYVWIPEKKDFGFNKNYSWRKTDFEQTDEHPVLNVSWNDAVAFCKWLSAKERKSYQLPTEAQWEYACRAGSKTRYSSGDDPETLATVGNVEDAKFEAQHPGWKEAIKAGDRYLFTAPVGKFRPNSFELYDMHGNAMQWCADWFDEDYYGKSPVDDPTGPDSGRERTVRGSSWHSMPYFSRSAFRWGRLPTVRGNQIGFRVSLTP